MKIEKTLINEQATDELGAQLAKIFSDGGVLYLMGELGTGKTTLTRSILRAMGVSGPIKSPTYTLVEEYKIQTLSVYHCDLYRLESPEELEFLGLEEHITKNSFMLIEWPEKGGGHLPLADVKCILQYDEQDAQSRKLQLIFNSQKHTQLADAIQ